MAAAEIDDDRRTDFKLEIINRFVELTTISDRFDKYEADVDSELNQVLSTVSNGILEEFFCDMDADDDCPLTSLGSSDDKKWTQIRREAFALANAISRKTALPQSSSNLSIAASNHGCSAALNPSPTVALNSGCSTDLNSVPSTASNSGPSAASNPGLFVASQSGPGAASNPGRGVASKPGRSRAASIGLFLPDADATLRTSDEGRKRPTASKLPVSITLARRLTVSNPHRGIFTLPDADATLRRSHAAAVAAVSANGDELIPLRASASTNNVSPQKPPVPPKPAALKIAKVVPAPSPSAKKCGSSDARSTSTSSSTEKQSPVGQVSSDSSRFSHAAPPHTPSRASRLSSSSLGSPASMKSLSLSNVSSPRVPLPSAPRLTPRRPVIDAVAARKGAEIVPASQKGGGHDGLKSKMKEVSKVLLPNMRKREGTFTTDSTVQTPSLATSAVPPNSATPFAAPLNPKMERPRRRRKCSLSDLKKMPY